jgi:hypothetical protein
VLGSLAVGFALLLWTVNTAEADAFRVSVMEHLEGVAVEDGNDGAGGSHALKRQGRRFVIETDAVSLRSVLLFTVVSVGKRLQRLSSEKYDV